MFVVKEKFRDSITNHDYKTGKIYPYNQDTISKERIKELSTKKNKPGKIMIEERKLEDLSEDQVIEYSRIIGIDIRETLINAINEIGNNSSNSNNNTKKWGYNG